MEPINAAKVQAMNNYKKSTTSTTTQFLNKFLLYSLTSLISGLVCSYPYWFPSLCYSMKHFLFTSLPNIWYFFINAKCLFIVGNFIVIFLIGESRLARARTPVAEVYDEYVKRSRIPRRAASTDIGEMKREEEVQKVEEGVNWNKENINKEKGKDCKEDDQKEENSDEDEGNDRKIDGEEETGLLTKELNKRVEEFIAKVKKQWRLEARLLV